MELEKTILLIDDEPFNRIALSALLRPRGYGCIEASGGKEGINILKNSPQINVVLMDIMMPEMSGYDAIREIREDEKYKDLCIIALTAKAMKEDRQKCIDAGASEYVTKPVDVDKLINVISGLKKEFK